MNFIILLAVSYLIGSINFAIILFKLLGREDPRKAFSGNAGVTNVYRMAGPAWAAAVLLLDVGRAVGVALLAVHLLPIGMLPWPGLALVVGNRFPCFHRFRGGKGVANYLGFSAVIAPLWAGASALAWVLAYFVVRIPFIASFVMILVLAAGTIVACRYEPWATAGAIMTTLFIMINHKKNIAQLMQNQRLGQETAGQKKNEEGEE